MELEQWRAEVASLVALAATVTAGNETIHVLAYGAALCGAGVPTAWPPDHRWCYVADAMAHATCPGCILAAAVLATRYTQPARRTSQGWIGVDFDGTLAEYHGDWRTLGAPIPDMLERVRRWVDAGREVRIVTARADYPDHVEMIGEWLRRHGLPELPVTAKKDIYMVALWDDSVVTVEKNTGVVLGRPTGRTE